MRSSPHPPDRIHYYPYIDGIRALAVLSVLIFHLHGPWLPGGFVGVDVFFVISGFIVSASIAKFERLGFLRFLGFFYARRIKRIFPALTVCLLVTICLTVLFIPASWLSQVNQQTGLSAFFGLSNFVLAQSGRDYFAPTVDFNPFAHTWSLAVEEQFYVLFPVMFFAWLANGRGWKLSVTLFAFAVLVSLAWGGWQTQTDPTRAYFLTPSRFWELAAGVLLYQLLALKPEPSRSGEHPGILRGLLGAGSLLIMLAAFVLSKPEQSPVPGVVPAVLGTLGVIWSLHQHPEQRHLHHVLSGRSLVFTGKISYSLYLWHWPIFVLFRWTWGLESLLLRVLALVLAFLLAGASWRFIETPIRRSGRLRYLPHGAVVAGGVVAIACAWFVAKSVSGHQSQLSLSVVSRNPTVWYPDTTPPSSEYAGCSNRPDRERIEGGSLLTFSAKGCIHAPAPGEASVYAMGDSHAMAYEGLFKQYARSRGTPVHVYANAGCPVISLQPSRDIEIPWCRQATDAALRDLHTRAKPGDVLFLPSLRLARLSDQWIYFGELRAKDEMLGARADEGRQRAIAHAVANLRELAERGVHIVFEAPKPLFKAPPFRCADWFNRTNPICAQGFSISRELLDTLREPVLRSFAEIARQVPGVSVWDPYPILCPEEQCNAWRDGLPLFLDGDHISGYGNRLLLPSFTTAMDAALVARRQSNGE